MKSMKNFAAQQLSKKEMNNVKGGKTYSCSLADGTWFPAYIEANSAREAERFVKETYAYDVSCM